MKGNPPQMLAMLLSTSAEIELSVGFSPAGAELVAEAVDTAIRSKDLPVAASAAVLAAQLNLLRENLPRAAELLGVADGLRGSTDPTNPTVAQLERDLGRRLGEEQFSRLRARGGDLARDDALALLLDSARV